MRGEDIDLVLARDDNIVPSSGFAASVMDAVTREATTPPPIPFPWKRALPGPDLVFGREYRIRYVSAVQAHRLFRAGRSGPVDGA